MTVNEIKQLSNGAQFRRADLHIHSFKDGGSYDVEDVGMTPGVCRELARITQEALVNVRKHSRAKHVLVRLGLTAVVGVAASYFAFQLHYSSAVALLAGWDLAGLFLFSLAWVSITGCDAEATSQRAAAEDPGRTVVYAIVTLTSVVSLFAATVMSRQAKDLAPTQSRELVILCLATVALSWALTHASFTLRYAHLFYREDNEGVGGVEFPGGKPPTYSDFAYFAFTIGMCFQVSDVVVSSRQIRSAVLLHALLSFLYNTAILAFALNLAFNSPA